MLVASTDFLIACSTLAVYVYNLKDFTLHRIIAGSTRAITAVAICPADPDLVAVASRDGTIKLWSIANERRLELVQLSDVVVAMDWSSCNPTDLLLGFASGAVAVWQRGHPELGSKLVHLSGSASPTVARWSPKRGGAFVVGTSDGRIVFGAERGKPSVHKPTQSAEVADVQWDPLSDVYLLVAYRTGAIELWDFDGQAVLNTFDRQGAGLCAVAWASWAPGTFFSANYRLGVLRVWNVSQRQPTSVVKVRRAGIKNLTAVPASERIACSFNDGALGVFHMTRSRLEWISPPGHKETIFEVAFHASNPALLATSSFDSTVKIWDLDRDICLNTLSGQEGILYAVAWAPDGSNRVASASSEGSVFVWDADSGKVLLKAKHHRGKVFRMSWNPRDSNLLCSCGADNVAAVLSVDMGNVTRRLKLPGEAYGCDWCPTNHMVLAVACADGKIRVFDTGTATTTPTRTLSGHTARAFNVAWSPLVADVLASGSDDRTVRVWRVDTAQCLMVLTGHSSNVRALHWSRELPYLLFSGSWDGTVRVWDARKGVCRKVVRDHHADVYGFDAHADRPFTFASSSRDTTLRLWTMGEEAQELRLRAMLGEPLASLLGADATAQFEPVGADGKPSAAPLLCGHGSRRLLRLVEREVNELERLRRIYCFFTSANGLQEFWDLLRLCHERLLHRADATPTTVDAPTPAPETLLSLASATGTVVPVAHASQVVGSARQAAAALQRHATARRGVVRQGPSSEEVATMIARLHMQTGDMRAYCEAMATLGQWDRALAAAPAVGLQYWRALCDRRAEQLADAGGEEAVPLMLAAGLVDEALSFYRTRGQLDDAFLVARARDEGAFPLADQPIERSAAAAPMPTATATATATAATATRSLSRGESKGEEPVAAPNGGALPLDGRGGREPDVGADVRAVAEQIARKHYTAGNPVLAACAFLRVDDAESAAQVLLKADELELAYVVAHFASTTNAHAVTAALARRCERLKLSEHALRLLGSLPNGSRTTSLAVARMGSDWGPASVERLYTEAHLRLPRSFAEQAAELAARGGAVEEVVYCLAMAQDPRAAAETALKAIDAVLRKPTWDLSRAMALFEPLKSVNVAALAPSLRARVLAYAALFGAYQAMWRDFHAIVPSLCSTVRQLVREFAVPLATPLCMLSLEEAWYTARRDPAAARTLLARVIAQATMPDERVRMTAQRMMDEISGLSMDGFASEGDQAARGSVSGTQVVPTGARLPTGTHASVRPISMISGLPIYGPEFVLEDHVHVVSKAEALMWAQVNPFSPLNTGARMFPF